MGLASGSNAGDLILLEKIKALKEEVQDLTVQLQAAQQSITQLNEDLPPLSDFVNGWSDIPITSSGLSSDFFNIVEGGYSIIGGKLVVVNIRLKPKSNPESPTSAFVNGFPKPKASRNVNYVSCQWHSLDLVHQAYIDTATGTMQIDWTGVSTTSSLLIGAVYIAK